MRLYITPGSPYARMARIVVLEKGLQGRVETIAAKTRVADSPYYDINPSGRVPYLITEEGVGLEESALICAYLDHLDGRPALESPGDGRSWEARRLEALARSMLDGLSVWGREILRPEDERSPRVIRHETDRAQRMADVWEREIDHPLMRGALNMIQLTLACALGLEARNPGFRWRAGHPKLAEWFDRIAARPSFAATAPPESEPDRKGSPRMPRIIASPTIVEAAGNKPKRIEEYVGRVNSNQSEVSVARMVSPAGWIEPGQRPEFMEITVVLAGRVHVEHEGGECDVAAGQSIVTKPGEWVRYSTPDPGGAEYIAVCLPAFSPATVHRDEK